MIPKVAITEYYSQYKKQKYKAGCRGIPFLLSYQEWLDIWKSSGHLQERGPGKGQYVMARYGDKGPYAVGNVKIILSSDNLKEVWPGRKHTEETKEKFRAHKHSEETKLQMSKSGKKGWEKRKTRATYKEEISEASKKSWAKWQQRPDYYEEVTERNKKVWENWKKQPEYQSEVVERNKKIWETRRAKIDNDS